MADDLLERAKAAPGDATLAARALPLLDLTSLNDTDTDAGIEQLCRRAITNGTAAVCIGPRFPDLSQVYDPALREQLARIAKAQGIDLPGGVYLAVLGPSFETPAEIRAFRALGADLVGMSTVPEAISARHAGLRVVGLSAVTNLAAGLAATPLSHQDTLEQAAVGAAKLGQLLRAFCKVLADG
jgi:purine nucleoside phosphorylase